MLRHISTHSYTHRHCIPKTHAYPQAHYRGWWGIQWGVWPALCHIAHPGQAWDHIPRWPPHAGNQAASRWTSRTTSSTSVSGRINSDPCLLPASNWCQNQPSLRDIPGPLCCQDRPPWLHGLWEKHCWFRGQADWCSTGFSSTCQDRAPYHPSKVRGQASQQSDRSQSPRRQAKLVA